MTESPATLPDDALWPVGTRVFYIADPRITGTVVGYGFVDNAADDATTDRHTFTACIVRIDGALRHDDVPTGLFFHTPIVASALRPIKPAGIDDLLADLRRIEEETT